jgi:alkanesulfonate monooxygenase SsuD/methylene tetrahydromethanopterin reductase-like flavin-dependent oxidoreductase (luciferase family)
VRYSVTGTMNMTWEEARDCALLCEELGFEELYASDHLRAVAGFDEDKSLLDAMSLITALAPLTSRIRLGCLVSPVSFRHPSLLLRQLQSLDVITGGRAVAGLGAGWSPEEHADFGFPFAPVGERLTALDDACRLFRDRWPGLRPKPPQQQVRLLVAGASPRALRIAARHADAWNGIGTVGYIEDRIGALRAAEGEVGRRGPPVEATLNLISVLSDDDASLAKVRERMVTASPNRVAKAQARVALPDEGAANGMFIGRPEDLAPEIARYGAVGVERVILTLPRPFRPEAVEDLARAAGVTV